MHGSEKLDSSNPPRHAQGEENVNINAVGKKKGRSSDESEFDNSTCKAVDGKSVDGKPRNLMTEDGNGASLEWCSCVCKKRNTRPRAAALGSNN